MGERSAADKALIKLDERVNIVYLLYNKMLPGIFPDPNDSNHTWYAPGEDLSGFERADSLYVAQTFNWYLTEVTHSLKSGDWSKPDEVLNQIAAYQLENDGRGLSTLINCGPKRGIIA